MLRLINDGRCANEQQERQAAQVESLEVASAAVDEAKVSAAILLTNGFHNLHLTPLASKTNDKLALVRFDCGPNERINAHAATLGANNYYNQRSDLNDTNENVKPTSNWQTRHPRRLSDDQIELDDVERFDYTILDDLGVESAQLNADLEFKCGYPKRVRSLVDDAKFDTQRNRELAENRHWLFERLSQQSFALSSDASESVREQLVDEKSIDPTIVAASDIVAAVVAAATSTAAKDACLLDFPRHISQLDECNHLLIKYEPELDPTHPGFHDLEYRERRKAVAQIAFNYKYGQRIPDVEYNAKEIQTWRFIYTRLKEAYAKYACEQHNKAIGELERDCGYSADSIPQLQRVSEFLERKSGWRLRPAAGLLSARDFLASLAFRVFQTTQYIRHWGNPEHSVEPDCIHELMGHIPMLCDPSFAQFSQEIGLASLGASDEQIEKFATLYWFTVEFGLCRERGQLKCYGAGLLSSYGEMEHALESNKPALKEFVPEETAVESYDDSEYQVSYYVAQSFDDAKLKIKQYTSKHLQRDFELAYEPYSCTIQVLDSLERLELYSEQVKNDVMRLSSAIGKLRLTKQRLEGDAKQAREEEEEEAHQANKEQESTPIRSVEAKAKALPVLTEATLASLPKGILQSAGKRQQQTANNIYSSNANNGLHPATVNHDAASNHHH